MPRDVGVHAIKAATIFVGAKPNQVAVLRKGGDLLANSFRGPWRHRFYYGPKLRQHFPLVGRLGSYVVINGFNFHFHVADRGDDFLYGFLKPIPLWERHLTCGNKRFHLVPVHTTNIAWGRGRQVVQKRQIRGCLRQSLLLYLLGQ